MAPIVSHPLYFQLHWICQCALRTVRECRDPFFHTTTLDDYRAMSPLVRGAFVGTTFQRKLMLWLQMTYPGMWREGGPNEPDIVCTHNADFSLEVKTSGKKGNSINGNRVQASANKAPSYLLYVNYHPDTLTIRDVRLGWCGPNDWQASNGNSQSAYLKPEAVERFASVPIHGNLSMLSFAARELERNETEMVDWHN